MNELSQRIVTGLSFVACMIAGVYWSPLSLLFLFLLVNVLALWEYNTLISKYLYPEEDQPKTEKIIYIFWGSLLYMLMARVFATTLPNSYLFLVLPILFLFFIVELFNKQTDPFPRIGLQMVGLLQYTLPCTLINALAHSPNYFEPDLVFGMLGMVWASDSGAYFMGRWLGKTPLFPRISPKKTWEGWLGGALSSLFVAFIAAILFPYFSLKLWLGMAVLVAIFGALGDLVESMLKRSVDQKDSGQLLPGHGGILDRFDAVFFATPFVVAFVYFMLW